jgi:CHAD domain-containing protein
VKGGDCVSRSAAEKIGGAEFVKGLGYKLEPLNAIAVGDFALQVLESQYRQIRAREAGTKLGKNLEDLHKMRVASRRIRAGLAVFRDIIPRDWKRLRKEFGWVGEKLGAVRDLDVLRIRVRELAKGQDLGEGLKRLKARLEDEQRGARAELYVELESRRADDLFRGAERLLQLGPLLKSEAQVGSIESMPSRIEKLRGKFEKGAKKLNPKSSPGERHGVRILAKKYRYGLEFEGKADSKPLIKKLAKLQDGLGAQQDFIVGSKSLRELAGEDREIGAAVDGLIERFEELAVGEQEKADALLEELLGGE